MKILFDLFPVILFFATYKFMSHGSETSACLPDAAAGVPWMQQPILVATAVAIAASFVQIGWLALRKKKIDGMLWVSFAIVSVFGGATLYFHDATFIQWKPTVLYWVLALSLAGAQLFGGRNLTRAAMETAMKLPNRVWQHMNLSWMVFFVLLGFANIAAMRNLSCSGWVNFKVWGATGLMMVFVMLQLAAVYKYVEEEKEQN